MTRRAGRAALATIGALSAAVAIPVTPAAAAPTHVAVTISGHGSVCFAWHSGMTGDDLLNAVASVQYRQDGLIVQIDGTPASAKADNTHYWSYWHDTSGTWQYSSVGAGSYVLQPGAVDGWSYDDGASSAPRPGQDPSGLYAAICAGRDPVARSSAPAPPHRTTTTTRAPRRTSTGRAGGPAPSVQSASSAGVRSPGGSGTSAGPATPTAVGTTGPARASAARTRTSSGVASSTAAPHVLAAAPTAPGAPADTHSALTRPVTPSRSAAPAVLGLVLALLLAGGGGWAALRRRRA